MPPPIKAFQTTKITKLGLLSLSEGSQYQKWKANLYSPLLGNDHQLLDRKSDLLTTTSLMSFLRD